LRSTGAGGGCFAGVAGMFRNRVWTTDNCHSTFVDPIVVVSVIGCPDAAAAARVAAEGEVGDAVAWPTVAPQEESTVAPPAELISSTALSLGRLPQFSGSFADLSQCAVAIVRATVFSCCPL
jgi:hypothetical protein